MVRNGHQIPTNMKRLKNNLVVMRTVSRTGSLKLKKEGTEAVATKRGYCIGSRHWPGSSFEVDGVCKGRRQRD